MISHVGGPHHPQKTPAEAATNDSDSMIHKKYHPQILTLHQIILILVLQEDSRWSSWLPCSAECTDCAGERLQTTLPPMVSLTIVWQYLTVYLKREGECSHRYIEVLVHVSKTLRWPGSEFAGLGGGVVMGGGYFYPSLLLQNLFYIK